MIKQLYKEKAESLGLTCLFDEEIRPGDMYLANRNSGFKLLTCLKVNEELRFIIPTDNDEYYYDTWECVKVVEK